MKETNVTAFLRLPMIFPRHQLICSQSHRGLHPKRWVHSAFACSTVSLRKCSEHCTLISKVQLPGYWCPANSQQTVSSIMHSFLLLSVISFAKCILFQTDFFPERSNFHFLFLFHSLRDQLSALIFLCIIFPLFCKRLLLLPCFCGWFYMPELSASFATAWEQKEILKAQFRLLSEHLLFILTAFVYRIQFWFLVICYIIC